MSMAGGDVLKAMQLEKELTQEWYERWQVWAEENNGRQ